MIKQLSKLPLSSKHLKRNQKVCIFPMKLLYLQSVSIIRSAPSESPQGGNAARVGGRSDAM